MKLVGKIVLAPRGLFSQETLILHILIMARSHRVGECIQNFLWLQLRDASCHDYGLLLHKAKLESRKAKGGRLSSTT